MPGADALNDLWSEAGVVEAAWPVVLLGLRIAVAALLYLFLLAAFRALRAELRPGDAPNPYAPMAHVIEVTACDGADGLVGRRYPLERTSVIGRLPSSTAILDDPRVSPQHARLASRDGRWWIEDLGSRSGTYVGGRRVSEPVMVGEGDELRFGPVSARITTRGAPR